ncbi:MAG: hypothetical protein ACYC27_09205 [Armatimonadota bacterium]
MVSNKTTSVTIENFCRQSLSLLGVSVIDDNSSVWTVDIPQSRLDLFEGRPVIKLAFDPEHAGKGIDLVVPGSYVIERLVESVRKRGDLLHINPKPFIHPAFEPGISLLNGDARLISSNLVYRPVLAVNFRVSLVSDEDEDHMLGVVIDLHTGKAFDIDLSPVFSADLQVVSQGYADEGNLSIGFALAQSSAEEFAKKLALSAQCQIDAALKNEIIRINEYYNDLAVDTIDGNGTQNPRKLQAHRDKAAAAYNQLETDYDNLSELLINANDRFELQVLIKQKKGSLRKQRRGLLIKVPTMSSERYYTGVNSIDNEIKALDKMSDMVLEIVERFPRDKRLPILEEKKAKALDDLRGRWEKKETVKFSEDYIQQVNSEFESEKAQRVAELEDKCRLSVKISPINAALIQYPYQECKFDAVSGSSTIPFTSTYDLINGKVEIHDCQSCGKPLTSAYICACGHLACPSCHKTCAGCGMHICSSCVKTTCQLCGCAICDGCRNKCADCGKIVCPEHTVKCTSCHRVLCKDDNAGCSKTCVVCSNDFCLDHSLICSICQSTVCINDTRTCDDCGRTACKIDIGDCPSCGKVVCRDHSKTCKFCGQNVCGECIDSSGYCGTCINLFQTQTSVPAIELILSGLLNDNRLHEGIWYIGENRQRFVLVNMRGRIRIYVIDKSTGKLYSEHSPGFMESLQEKIRIRKRILHQ